MPKRVRDALHQGTKLDRRQAVGLGAGLAVTAALAKSRQAAAAAVPSPTTLAGIGRSSDAELLTGIDHIVVLMMENRSFDHVFGNMQHDTQYPAKAQIESLRGDEGNTGTWGDRVTPFHLQQLTQADPPHDWDSCRSQWNSGKNDGFVQAHGGPWEHEVMGYFERSEQPFTYWLADQFTVCDHWFASVLGPTWPNRVVMHAATAAGLKTNLPLLNPPTTLWEALASGSASAKNYVAGLPFFAGAFLGKLLAGVNPLATLDEFFTDARAGTLPNFSLIDPDFSFNDDHPSHNVHLGQALIASIYQALAASPQWSRSLLVITYDEHGGFFDHVPPPTCGDEDAQFRQLGFRVPAIVAGPTVRRGAVCSVPFEHASVAATLGVTFGMPVLSERMRHSNNLAACIDPAAVGAPRPAPQGAPVIELAELTAMFAEAAVSSQPELAQMAQDGTIPAHLLDPRSREERIKSWLATAAELGCVRFK